MPEGRGSDDGQDIGRKPGTSHMAFRAPGAGVELRRMGWLGATDLAGIHGEGDAHRRRWSGPTDAGALLAQGTLRVELRAADPASGAPVTLLDSCGPRHWPSRLRLCQLPGGGIGIDQVQGTARRSARIAAAPLAAAGDELRLSFSWDAPARRGLLTAENLSRGTLHQVDCPAPLPLFAAEAEAIAGGSGVECHPGVRLLAVSDRAEPVGPQPGIGGGAWVETPSGLAPVAALGPGDRVMTRDHGWREVLWCGASERVALGPQTPVRLRAPYFGLAGDLLVAPEQRLLVRGPAVEYLFGADEALAAAAHLADGEAAYREAGTGVARFHHLLLDRHAVIRVSGGWMESLFAGDLGADPALRSSSVLAGMDPAEVPRHRFYARRTLKPYEVATLLAAPGVGWSRRAA